MLSTADFKQFPVSSRTLGTVGPHTEGAQQCGVWKWWGSSLDTLPFILQCVPQLLIGAPLYRVTL
jgi:hypothetical protein